MRTGWQYVLKQLSLIFLVALLAVLFLAVGLMLGYGVIGDGQHVTSILSLAKWAELVHKFTGK
ncbi:DNA-directed RNA polymerase subunit beta [Streptococcus halichoeri]|uniref:DNA-directed RNA polymerase subunit beta n=1 Tax=Streptococcus halichoeri TaxID=254785 RepID=UPI00135A0EC4|nr:DNA-directed RNA polymerase subunit beta [Streptococcus halichoeri]